MAKKLISFRLEQDRIEEMQELANVYTNGNSTKLIEALIRQMYFLEPLALRGKYRTPGFGVSGNQQQKFRDAWDIWMANIYHKEMPKTAQANQKVKVTINGDYTELKRSEIRELAHLLRIPIDTRCVYTISVKKTTE